MSLRPCPSPKSHRLHPAIVLRPTNLGTRVGTAPVSTQSISFLRNIDRITHFSIKTGLRIRAASSNRSIQATLKGCGESNPRQIRTCLEVSRGKPTKQLGPKGSHDGVLTAELGSVLGVESGRGSLHPHCQTEGHTNTHVPTEPTRRLSQASVGQVACS